MYDGAKFLEDTAALHGDFLGQAQPQQNHSSETDQGDGGEGGAPAGNMTKSGTEGDAENIGHGQASKHQCNSLSTFIMRHQFGGDDSTDTEEGCMTECRHDTRYHQEVVR